MKAYRIKLLATAALCAATSLQAGADQARLGLDSASYFAAPRVDHALELGLEGSTHNAFAGVEGSFQGRYILGTEQSLAIEAPEAYVWGGPAQEVAFGRKLHRWSRLDEEWELGLWQPRFRWDYLHPTAAGLTGTHLNVSAGSVRFTGFGSFFFVPERGASVWSDQGRLRSSSPWFISPPRQARFVGVETPLAYDIAETSLKDILLQSSWAAQVEIGEKTGPWASLAYANKPMNQLAFGVSGYYALAPELIQATIHPRVLRHQLISAETGLQNSLWGLRMSYLFENPDRDETPADWRTQEARIAHVLSPAVDVTLGRDTGVSVSYLYVSGGNAADGMGSMSGNSASKTIFEERYPFTRAVKARVHSSVAGPWGRRVSGSSSVLVDLGSDERSEPGRGMIWSTELRYAKESGDGVTVALGADVLAADSSTSDESFIARYRANHRVHAGVSYAF